MFQMLSGPMLQAASSFGGLMGGAADPTDPPPQMPGSGENGGGLMGTGVTGQQLGAHLMKQGKGGKHTDAGLQYAQAKDMSQFGMPMLQLQGLMQGQIPNRQPMPMKGGHNYLGSLMEY